MYKHLLVFSLMFVAIQQSRAQVASVTVAQLVVDAGGMTIASGETFHFEGLTLTPSANFTLTSTTLEKNQDYSISPFNKYIQPYFRFNPLASGYNGNIRFSYVGSDLKGSDNVTITESTLRLHLNDGTNWSELASTADVTNDYVTTSSAVSNLGLNILMLAAHVTAPTTQASSLVFSSTNNSQTTISWTNGNGSDRVVFVKAASSGTPSPVDGTTYTANTAFGSGTQIGSTGWYCVYNGTGSSVTVTGLSGGTTYQVMVVEYDPAAGGIYQTATATNNPNSVLTDDHTWTGSSSTDWNTAGNWNPASVPLTGANITIPGSLSNYPVLDQARTAGNLTVANGASINLGTNSLNVQGSLTENGTITGSGAVILSGSSAQTISGTGTVSNITLNNASGVSISSGSNTLTLTGTLTPTAGALTTNGNLVLKSDGSGTALIAPGSGTYITGDVTVERYIGSGNRAWRFLSLPVTGTTLRNAWAGASANASAPTGETAGSGTLITGHGYLTGAAAAAAGFDWFTGLSNYTSSSIRYYDGMNDHWNSSTNTPSLTTTPDKPAYMLYVRGDRTVASTTAAGATTLRPKGALKLGTQTYAISNLYEPVGNPYASPIDLDAVYANSGNSALIERNFWVWDPALGSSGGFRNISYNGTQYDMTGGTGTATDYLKVQSGQGFFVKKVSSGSMTIQESNKVGGTAPVMFGVATPIKGTVGLLQMGLYQSGKQLDGVAVRFNQGYQLSPTEVYDMDKMNNFNENLSLVNGTNYLSIESRPYPTSKDTVGLSFWNLAKSNYTLQLNSNNLASNIGSAVLIDKFTNTQTPVDLAGGNTLYNFAITSDAASSSLSRFTVVFSNQASLPPGLTSIAAKASGKGVSITWKTTQESNLNRYELERSADGINYTKIGTEKALNQSMGSSYAWLDLSPGMGTNSYRLKVINQYGFYQYSPIAVADWNRTAGIELLPTITSDGRVTLVLRNQAMGTYRVQLYGVNGARLYSKQLQQEQSSSLYELQLSAGGSALMQGIYYLEVTDGKGVRKRFTVVKN